MYTEDLPPRRKSLPNNVIGLPGLMMEVILMQPRSFEEIPDAVTALRERKAVILNLNYMEVDQAQRCADYVAGGAFAIDGHQRQIGENVFLFTPNFVHISNHQTVNPPVNPPVAPPSPPPFESSPPSQWSRQSPFEPRREF
jgi:cell division inhibitor SepF